MEQKIYAIHTDLSFYVMDFLQKIPDLVANFEIFRTWNRKKLANHTDLALSDMDLLYDPGSFTQGPEIRKKRSLFREFSVKSSKTYKQSTRTYKTGYFLCKWSNNYMQSTRIWHSMPWSSSKIPKTFVQMKIKNICNPLGPFILCHEPSSKDPGPCANF